MSYELGFLKLALKEWHKLDSNTRETFKKKLAERCESPHVPSAQLMSNKGRYKIKLCGGWSTKCGTTGFWWSLWP